MYKQTIHRCGHSLVKTQADGAEYEMADDVCEACRVVDEHNESMQQSDGKQEPGVFWRPVEIPPERRGRRR